MVALFNGWWFKFQELIVGNNTVYQYGTARTYKTTHKKPQLFKHKTK
jgi:hypothetical protein